jgi:hypothetical protein
MSRTIRRSFAKSLAIAAVAMPVATADVVAQPAHPLPKALTEVIRAQYDLRRDRRRRRTRSDNLARVPFRTRELGQQPRDGSFREQTHRAHRSRERLRQALLKLFRSSFSGCEFRVAGCEGLFA